MNSLLIQTFVRLAGKIAGDRAVDNPTSESLAFLFKLLQSSACVCDLRLCVLALPVELDLQAVTDRVLDCLGQTDGLPVALDRRLDDMRLDKGLVAAGALPLAPEAEEVEVRAAVALGLGQAQPAATTTAEDAALEVVVMGPDLLARQPTLAEDLLDLIEQHLVDQRLMSALVLDTVEAHVPQVVAVGQECGYMTALYESGFPPAAMR